MLKAAANSQLDSVGEWSELVQVKEVQGWEDEDRNRNTRAL
jgi:hypothetical protein